MSKRGNNFHRKSLKACQMQKANEARPLPVVEYESKTLAKKMYDYVLMNGSSFLKLDEEGIEKLLKSYGDRWTAEASNRCIELQWDKVRSETSDNINEFSLKMSAYDPIHHPRLIKHFVDEKVAEARQQALNEAAEHLVQRGFRPFTNERVTARGVLIVAEEIKNLKPKS